jgi:hypothetical protein
LALSVHSPREFVNSVPRIKQNLMADRSQWMESCSALDVVGDAEMALDTYLSTVDEDGRQIEDESGRIVDFHSLRVSFVPELQRGEAREAIERLPDLRFSVPIEARATATSSGESALARCLASRLAETQVEAHRGRLGEARGRAPANQPESVITTRCVSRPAGTSMS